MLQLSTWSNFRSRDKHAKHIHSTLRFLITSGRVTSATPRPTSTKFSVNHRIIILLPSPPPPPSSRKSRLTTIMVLQSQAKPNWKKVKVLVRYSLSIDRWGWNVTKRKWWTWWCDTDIYLQWGENKVIQVSTVKNKWKPYSHQQSFICVLQMTTPPGSCPCCSSR